VATRIAANVTTLKIVTSPLWHHRVTRRRWWHHQSMRRRHFPVGSLLDTNLSKLLSFRDT